MSRLGKIPVEIPGGVSVKLASGQFSAEGPKGRHQIDVHPDITVNIDEEAKMVTMERPSDQPRHRALHGLTRSLVANTIEGVHKGYEKKLEIHGVGYNAKMEGKNLVMNLGYNAPVKMPVPEGLECETPSNTEIVIRGVDKQKVGQFAVNVRMKRPPEPYKQKGIRYSGEQVKKKAGKSFVSGA